MFKVIATETYEEELAKWPKADKEAAEKIPKKLAENPYNGNQLSYPFLREKRVNEKRVYYLVYDNLQLVLMVATSDKKGQQATIDHIKSNLNEFKLEAERIAKQLS